MPHCHVFFSDTLPVLRPHLEPHLPRCSKRQGRDFSHWLTSRPARGSCPQCKRRFKRIDTHRRVTCRVVADPCTSPAPPTSSAQTMLTTEGVSAAAQLPPAAEPVLQGQQNRFPSQHLPPLRLSLTVEERQLADEVMLVTVVPAVLLCDENNIALCDGVYQYFSQHFGTARQVQRKGPRQDKEQSSRLKKITQQKKLCKEEAKRGEEVWY